MKLLVIILFSVITVIGSVYAISNDKKSKETNNCPYLKSKQQTECPYLNKNFESNNDSNNSENKIDGCPFLNKKSEQKDVCPYSGKSGSGTIEETKSQQKWVEIRS